MAKKKITNAAAEQAGRTEIKMKDTCRHMHHVMRRDGWKNCWKCGVDLIQDASKAGVQ